ncbi:MAG: contact-dependent growth inhibition system immunity protein [Bacteroidota bacterium]|nr:contact-dependent growth inhibition system immunity protein [Bacteroidota bacterium]
MNTKEAKYEINWRKKSLENLEKDYLGESNFESHLVKTCHQLRQKPLKEFNIEDLRIMIGQNIGLKFLVPLALENLKQDMLAQGDYDEGDLLKSILTSEKEFWDLEP